MDGIGGAALYERMTGMWDSTTCVEHAEHVADLTRVEVILCDETRRLASSGSLCDCELGVTCQTSTCTYGFGEQ